MTIVRIYRSPEHIYRGHSGGPAGSVPMAETPRVRVVAGKGVEGDRYSRLEGTKGQVTFFEEETWQRLCDALDTRDRQPDVFRRNIIVRGVRLNELIGKEFEVQGVRFLGIEHCKPCFWMEQAFSPGTLKLLADWEAGGLRAQVLTDGWLSVARQEAGLCSA